MSSPADLYQDIIIKHYRNPANHFQIKDAKFTAIGTNPHCGDELKVYFDIAENRIITASFTSKSCAIATASASIMTITLQGKTLDEAERFIEIIKRLYTEKHADEGDFSGDIAALLQVLNFPARIKCAYLPWKAAMTALKKQNDPTVTTE